MRLTPDLSGALKLADEPFSSEEASNEALTRLTWAETQGVLVGHDMSRIDRIPAIYIHFIDGPERVHEDISGTSTFHPEHALSGEQSVGHAGPGRVDLDVGAGG